MLLDFAKRYVFVPQMVLYWLETVSLILRPGAGAEPPQNLSSAAAVVQTVLPLKWSGRKRGQGCQILFPVFGGEMATAKIQTAKG